MSTAGGALTLPSQFGRYTLLERLAVGGMAEVFRAKIVSSHGFEKILVIKRILPHLAADATFVSMFIDEAKLTAQLTHPKIVQILDFGDVAGQYFIALEFVDGFDALGLLRTCAQKRVRLPLHLAVFIVIEVLEALDYAHNARDMEGKPMHIVHRDISPSNIFMSKRGDVKLGDFGIAHAQRARVQDPGRHAQGQVRLHVARAGRRPAGSTGAAICSRSASCSPRCSWGGGSSRRANDLDVLLMVRDARIERLAKYGRDLPPALDRIVRRALKKDPRERYPTAAAFRDALGDYLYETGQRVGPPDLRAFVGDLFDASPEAAERLARDARKVAEANAQAGARVAARGAAGGGTVTEAADVMNTERTSADEPDLAALMAAGLHESTREVPADAARSARRARGRRRRPDRSADGAARAQPLTAVDDGWPADEENERSSVRGFTGWTRLEGGAPPVRPVRARMSRGPHPGVGKFISGAPKSPPDSAGDVSVITPMRLFCDLAVAGETGLLRFEVPGTIKEVFLVKGAPESVNSSLSSERFGEYLVAKEVLGRGDLEFALGMLPQYNGKLGDTLVALGLLKPLDVFRLLSQQVRDRVIDVFGWTQGTFAFYRGTTNPADELPARARHVRDPGRRRREPPGRAARAALRAAARLPSLGDRPHAHRARGLSPGTHAARGAGDAGRRANAARLDGPLHRARRAADVPARAVPAGRDRSRAVRLSERVPGLKRVERDVARTDGGRPRAFGAGVALRGRVGDAFDVRAAGAVRSAPPGCGATGRRHRWRRRLDQAAGGDRHRRRRPRRGWPTAAHRRRATARGCFAPARSPRRSRPPRGAIAAPATTRRTMTRRSRQRRGRRGDRSREVGLRRRRRDLGVDLRTTSPRASRPGTGVEGGRARRAAAESATRARSRGSSGVWSVDSSPKRSCRRRASAWL